MGYKCYCGFRLHEVLMDLQHQQLQQLSDWLRDTEGRIRKMETDPMADDMQGYLAQIEQHRVSQLVKLSTLFSRILLYFWPYVG